MWSWRARAATACSSSTGTSCMKAPSTPSSRCDNAAGRSRGPTSPSRIADHYVPTRAARPADREPRDRAHGRPSGAQHRRTRHRAFGLDDPRQGIVHVAIPEQGLTLPGLTIVCGDSHTSTHGAFGAYAFGIGASEVAHVLMTQTIWQKKPKRMRLRVEGAMLPGTTAKDIALTFIARDRRGWRARARHRICRLGRARALDGGPHDALQSFDRGGRAQRSRGAGRDDLAWLNGRPFAPKAEMFERAVADWDRLASDADAGFDREVVLDGGEIVPIVTWGTSPEHASPIDASVPDPSKLADPARAAAIGDAIAYMGLTPGAKLSSITVDRVFIGSCTNGRIEDLRAAAAVLAGRRAKVPGLVSSGIEQRSSGRPSKKGSTAFSAKLGSNSPILAARCASASMAISCRPGERCASTTNRNFKGRQGPSARTHLMSPAMAAAAAVAGHLTDARELLKGRV